MVVLLLIVFTAYRYLYSRVSVAQIEDISEINKPTSIPAYKDKSERNDPQQNLATAIPRAKAQQDLAGVITNSYGVRDDILDYILKTIPESNALARTAAIKFAGYEQMIYYGNITSQEAIALANKEVLIRSCLSYYLPNHSSTNFTRKMNKLLRNTKARDAHIWAVDTQVFSSSYISSGLSVAAETAACAKGEF